MLLLLQNTLLQIARRIGAKERGEGEIGYLLFNDGKNSLIRGLVLLIKTFHSLRNQD